MSTSTPLLNKKTIAKALKTFKKTGQFLIQKPTLLSTLVASIFAEKAMAQGLPVYAPAVAEPFGLDFSPKKFTTKYYGNLSNIDSIVNIDTSSFNMFSLADLDGDEDLDLIGQIRIFHSTASSDTNINSEKNEFVFLKNKGTKTNPSFDKPIFKPFNLPTDTIDKNSFFFNDLDGDGDLDMMYNSEYGKPFKTDFRYCKNIGTKTNPNFAPAIKNPFGLSTLVAIDTFQYYSTACVDFDKDGDLDLISSSSYLYFYSNRPTQRYRIIFHKNIGTKTAPNFQSSILLTDTTKSNLNNNVSYFYGYNYGSSQVFDYDKDGDLDIIRGGYNILEYNNSTVKYFLGLKFENNGNPTKPFTGFSLLNNIDNEDLFTNVFDSNSGTFIKEFNAYSSTFGDIDNDGDMDILSYGAFENDSSIAEFFGNFFITNFTKRAFYFRENLGHSNNTIVGTCFNDKNGNGTQQEATEDGMANVVLSFDKQGGTPHKGITITDTAGKFMFPALDGSYILKPVAPNYYTPAPVQVSINTADSNFVYERNFALKPTANIADLSCVITSGPTRPGFKVPYWFTYKNVGTKNLTGSLVYTKDSRLTYQTASQAPTSQAGNTITWNFTNIKPNESFTIYAEMLLSAGATLGDSLTNILAVLPSLGDQTPIDNQDTLKSIIVGSFDPNDKLVSPSGAGINGNIPISNQPLEYTVRFQNTGTDTAFNIIIQDSLDLDFDWSSLKIMASSHEVTAAIRSNNKIKFTFDNILLPHKAASEPKSHGFVKYSIQPKVGLVAGTKFHNTANIYFDYNAPIVTNTTVNTFFVSTGVYDNINQSYRLFPNPMHQKAVLQFDNMHGETFVLQLMDATGKVVKIYTVEGNQATIERQDLAPGIYIFSLQGQTTQSAGKLVVE